METQHESEATISSPLTIETKPPLTRNYPPASLLATVILCYLFVAFGSAFSIIGVTLPKIAERTSMKIDSMGLIFTLRGLGMVIGSLVGGKLIDFFQKAIARKIIALISALFMGICIFFVPISTSFAFTVTLHFFKGIAGGVLNVFCNTVMMLIWAEKANTFMQLLHFSNGVGSTISPIILTVISSMMNGYVSGVFSDWAVTYTIVAIMTALSGVFCMFCPRMDVQDKQVKSPNSIELTTPESPSANSPDDTSDTTKLIPKKPRREQALYFRILACSITSAALYFYVEAPYSGLIFTFIRLKRLSDDTGANMANSLFWLTLTIGRLLAIPLASMMKSRTMLLVDITGTFIAVLSMLMFRNSYIIVMIGTGLLGLSLASQFPTTISLPATYMGVKVSGLLTSLMILGPSAGAMLNPLFITSSFKLLGPNAFLYALMVMVLADIAIYAVLFVFFKKKSRRGKRGTSKVR